MLTLTEDQPTLREILAADAEADEMRRPCEHCQHRYRDHDDVIVDVCTLMRNGSTPVRTVVIVRCALCDCDNYEPTEEWNGD